jgi:hypothetical protein
LNEYNITIDYFNFLKDDGNNCVIDIPFTFINPNGSFGNITGIDDVLYIGSKLFYSF